MSPIEGFFWSTEFLCSWPYGSLLYLDLFGFTCGTFGGSFPSTVGKKGFSEPCVDKLCVVSLSGECESDEGGGRMVGPKIFLSFPLSPGQSKDAERMKEKRKSAPKAFVSQ